MTFEEFWTNKTVSEKDDFSRKLYAWLDGYTDEVINRVLENKLDEIVSNPTALMMLDEFYERKLKEKEKYSGDLIRLLEVKGLGGEPINFHRSKVLTHSDAYGNVLADMFIR